MAITWGLQTKNLWFIAEDMMTITYGGISEIGDKRTSNQDSILSLYGTVEGHLAGLFVVADGMGGLAYGREISSYIISELKRWWEIDLPQMLQSGYTGELEIQELLDQEIWDINQAALKFGKQTGKRSGSTLSLLFLLDQRYFIKNLGDSRIYRLRRQELTQMTVDQTTLQPVRKNGTLRYRPVLTMCIGVLDVPVAYSVSGLLKPKDAYLLCSDGLYNCLKEELICSIMQDSTIEPQEMAVKMRGLIPPGKAMDNLSVILVRIEEKKKGVHG